MERLAENALADGVRAVKNVSGAIYKAINAKDLAVLDTPKVVRELFMTVSGV